MELRTAGQCCHKPLLHRKLRPVLSHRTAPGCKRRHVRKTRQSCTPSAAVGPAPKAPDGGDNWEPWKNKSKDEAARRALQDMFKGQKDVLAAYDPGEAVSTSGGGPGGSSGGRGGGISWRPNWREWGDGFWRRARGAGQVFGAFLLLCGVFAAAALREPALKGISYAVRWVLRLEGSSTSGRRRIRGEHAPEVVGLDVSDRPDLGIHEKYVLSKYGVDDSYFAPAGEPTVAAEQPA